MEALLRVVDEADFFESLELLEKVRNEVDSCSPKQVEKMDLIMVMRGKLDDSASTSKSGAFM